MSYRDSFRRRFAVSSLTFADWAVLSTAVSAAAGGVIILFHLAAWLVGWPGPLLQYGGSNRLLEVALGGGAVAVTILMLNMLGACTLRLIFHAVKMLRMRRR